MFRYDFGATLTGNNKKTHMPIIILSVLKIHSI